MQMETNETEAKRLSEDIVPENLGEKGWIIEEAQQGER